MSFCSLTSVATPTNSISLFINGKHIIPRPRTKQLVILLGMIEIKLCTHPKNIAGHKQGIFNNLAGSHFPANSWLLASRLRVYPGTGLRLYRERHVCYCKRRIGMSKPTDVQGHVIYAAFS